ncbi:hypothetical protein LCGC14_2421250 [marine sediment metagenome]|uniref:DNA-binding protein HU n=1 Tax=marine sediment metagenome TaxID=412755 RepID=A0A0F9CBU3_9ZZZZ
MNKAELIEQVASQTGLAKRTAREAVDAVVSAISDCLTRGEKVTLVGFGTFGVRQRKARTGRNPQTGATIQIPAKRVAKFLPGKTLKEGVD